MQNKLAKLKYLPNNFEIIEEEGNASFRVVAEQLGLDHTLLNRWLKDKDNITAKAADETLANLKKRRPIMKSSLCSTKSSRMRGRQARKLTSSGFG